MIAAGLPPFEPDAAEFKAGHLMLEEIADFVRRGESFAFETTLSGLAYVRHIQHWRELGYCISLYFLALPSADAAVMRVAEHVQQGGHDIPETVIPQRFAAGRRNFEQHYRQLVNDWSLYGNTGNRPVLVEWGENP
jgi:predicted ABC-type ATPase